MLTLSALYVLASAAAPQSSGVDPRATGSYGAVMSAQYAARSEPVAQRPEEAQRVYDAYLNSIAQKTRSKSDTSPVSTGDQSR